MTRCSTGMVRMLWAGILVAFAGFAAAQQAYPSKPIRFITPYAPGGTTTAMARLVGQRLTENWGQQVIVDNRPGGNTIIGTEALAKSPPDGYTVMLTTSTHVLNGLQIRNLPFDAIKDFTPIATIASTETILALHPSTPANNFQEFVALAKSKPGQLNYATVGSGGLQHLTGELFGILSGVKTQHIPYKGSGPAVTDLLGGQVQFSFQNPISVIPHIKTGRLKAIAVFGDTRLVALPQVPTFTEAGLSGFDVKNWQGILAPAGIPKAIADRLSAEIGRIVAMPDTKEKLISQGLEPFYSNPDQLAALMKADMARFARIIKTANIRFEN